MEVHAKIYNFNALAIVSTRVQGMCAGIWMERTLASLSGISQIHNITFNNNEILQHCVKRTQLTTYTTITTLWYITVY